MKKTRVTKLLAVVAMTTGTAIADPRPVAPPPAPVAAREVSSIVAAAESALVAVRLLQQFSIELSRPRTLSSGAPACGNVASRAPRPASCEPRTEKP